MDILDLERTVNREWWMKQIADCDWSAGAYLYTMRRGEAGPHLHIRRETGRLLRLRGEG